MSIVSPEIIHVLYRVTFGSKTISKCIIFMMYVYMNA